MSLWLVHTWLHYLTIISGYLLLVPSSVQRRRNHSGHMQQPWPLHFLGTNINWVRVIINPSPAMLLKKQQQTLKSTHTLKSYRQGVLFVLCIQYSKGMWAFKKIHPSLEGLKTEVWHREKAYLKRRHGF